MHHKSLSPSFISVKVNGSHYACSLPALASARTHTRTKKYSHTIFRGFSFSISQEQKESSWRRHLLFPWAPAQPEGRWKVGVSLWIPTNFSSSFHPLLPSSFSSLCVARSIRLSAHCIYPKGESFSSITRLFPSSGPARCRELSGSLPDLNMAFRQLNMAFMMDGWQPRASILV